MIRKYGNWLAAIWDGKVPLETEKLKHFFAAKQAGFQGRTRIEDLWYRYKLAEVPF